MNNPTFQLSTRRGQFRVAVEGDPGAPALILSNSLGTTLEMWEPQVAGLSQKHRLIRYDTRGHGGSPITPGPYSFAELGQDVLAVLDALEISRAAFCGISMGGHTGLWLGIHESARFSAIAVCNSAAKIGTEQGWSERAAMVRARRADAMQALAESAPERWFSKAFMQAQPAAVRRMQDAIARLDPEGYAACCDALAVSDLRCELGRISTPMLLLAGELDPVCTVADAQAMQAGIAGSQLAVLHASHLSSLEAPHAFEKAVLDFVASA